MNNNNIINNKNADNVSTGLSIKAKSAAETRRFRLDTPTFANLLAALTELGLCSPASASLSWLDSDGDRIVFSSEREFVDAVAALAPNAVFTVYVTDHAAAPAAVSPVHPPAAAPAPAPTVAAIDDDAAVAAVWTALPIWRRYKLTHKLALTGDVHDAVAIVRQLTPQTRAWLVRSAAHHQGKPHGKFQGKQQAPWHAAAATTAAAAPGVAMADDEQLWAGAPLWFKERVLSKFVPELVPKANEFLAFQALPEHVKFRVRARCVQHQRQQAAPALRGPWAHWTQPRVAPHPPADVVADEAMWASMPDWMKLKIASKAARHGAVVSEPTSFALFQALPAWRQEKIRRKSAKFAAKQGKD